MISVAIVDAQHPVAQVVVRILERIMKN